MIYVGNKASRFLELVSEVFSRPQYGRESGQLRFAVGILLLRGKLQRCAESERLENRRNEHEHEHIGRMNSGVNQNAKSLTDYQKCVKLSKSEGHEEGKRTEVWEMSLARDCRGW